MIPSRKIDFEELLQRLAPLTPGERDEVLSELQLDGMLVSELLSRLEGEPTEFFPRAAAPSDIRSSTAADSSRYDGSFDSTRTTAAPTGEEAFGGEEPAPSKNRRVGRYELKDLLGRGGFATVYRAYDSQLHRHVALKIPHDSVQAGAQKRALLQEARAAARLSHPHLLTVFDAGEAPCGTLYIATELVEGRRTIRQYVEQRQLEPREVAGLVAQLAWAVQYLSSNNVVHRDLKPANILVTPDGQVKLADFGLAVSDDQRRPAGEIAGTVYYMSPEQVAGHGDLDGRVDIWSLGVVLYELLTERRPFQGRTRQEVFDAIRSRTPKPPRQLNGRIPPELERICLCCLERELGKRPTSAAEVAKLLERIAQPRKPVSLGMVAAASLAGLAGAAIVALVVLLVVSGTGVRPEAGKPTAAARAGGLVERWADGVEDVAWYAPDSTSFRGATPGGEQFLVSRNEGLFSAARYDRGVFTASTVFRSKDQAGGAGMFLGLEQQANVTDSGAEVRRACLVILVRWQEAGSQCELQIKRLHLRPFTSETWYVHEDELPLVSQTIPALGRGGVLLEVAVREGTVQSVRVANVSIDIPPKIRVAPAPSACGLYADGDDEGGEFVFENFELSEQERVTR